ncbi:MAG: autotransporter outer membrane beta-barrel domain-containing protein, partial [Pseudomonadota bacterium]
KDNAQGVSVTTVGRNASLMVDNSGTIKTIGRFSDGIFAYSGGRNSQLTVHNSGSVRAEGGRAYGIFAVSTAPDSPVMIKNSGEAFGSTVAVYSYSNTFTHIDNSGEISAGSGLAIDTVGERSVIDNSGLITGFIDLTNNDDTFKNWAGGEFNASETSTFRDGSDLFINQAGGTVRTASNARKRETTKFVQLERLENKGLITMVDGAIRDKFKISNLPGRTNLSFVGSKKSTLGVDAFLGGPGSRADTFHVAGTTSGRTIVSVNNVNPGPGRLNRQGIPVVFVEGGVKPSNFQLEKPIDTGFFDYDLVFTRTGSGRFDLKSHAGGGSHVTPRVITATHETFHSSTETWFDQSTDLRALIARGSVCDDIAHPDKRIRCQALYDVTPAVWARGAGSWFDFDDTETTKANGKTYRYDLSRNLDIWQLESGVDFGKEGIFTEDDILVFGALGGVVKSTLSFDELTRRYEMSSLEAGAYATYLRGGFFADTLFKAFFGDIDPKGTVEYPDTMDTQTYGLRFDSGYRFGGLKDGPFVEPLGTIAVSWTHIDDFSHKGNRVDFKDDEEVRGRIGLRTGTSMQVWEGTTFEPFVVGSLWGFLSDDHNTTVTSTGTTFSFSDAPDDVWGEVSGGVNFFNPEKQTAVFGKVDYRFAEDAEGVSAKAGMRVTW